MTLRTLIRRAVLGGTVVLGAGGLALGLAGVASAAPLPHHPAPDTLTLTYQGSSYHYAVSLHEQAVGPWSAHEAVISGTLRDTYEPHAITLPVFGIQVGRTVVISTAYPATGPDAGDQGVRTFSGVEGSHGQVTGSWSETGAEDGAGTFTLTSV